MLNQRWQHKIRKAMRSVLALIYNTTAKNDFHNSVELHSSHIREIQCTVYHSGKFLFAYVASKGNLNDLQLKLKPGNHMAATVSGIYK